MIKRSKLVAILIIIAFLSINSNVSAIGIDDFGFGEGPSGPRMTLTQNSDSLTVHTKFTNDPELRNLSMSTQRISLDPVRIEFSIDKCTFPNDLANGYINFNFFKDVTVSSTIGVNIMFLLAPVGLSESFEWMTENERYTGDGSKKLWVVVQDIIGNKIYEPDPWTINEDNPNGVIEHGYTIDVPYIGNHWFSYDYKTGLVIVNGVEIKIRQSHMNRLAMQSAGDLIIQTGGSSFNREFQYTLKKINGQVVNNKSGPVGPWFVEPSPGTSTPTPVPDTSSSEPSPTAGLTPGTTPGTTQQPTITEGVSEQDSSSEPNEETISEPDSSEETVPDSTQGEEPPFGQNIGIRNLDTIIDFENNTVKIAKPFTVEDFIKNFNVASSYSIAVIDSDNNIITDLNTEIDDTMSLALFFGNETTGDPEQRFKVVIGYGEDTEPDEVDAPSSPIILIIIILSIFIIASILLYFFIKRKKA